MDFFDNERVGKRLRHLRCIMDISVSEMADSLGVTTQDIFVNGKEVTTQSVWWDWTCFTDYMEWI